MLSLLIGVMLTLLRFLVRSTRMTGELNSPLRDFDDDEISGMSETRRYIRWVPIALIAESGPTLRVTSVPQL